MCGVGMAVSVIRLIKSVPEGGSPQPMARGSVGTGRSFSSTDQVAIVRTGLSGGD